MIKPDLQPPLTLAYLGDAVYTLLVREHLVKTTTMTPNKLHKKTVSFLCAAAQAQALDIISCELDETEQNIVRRGRNAKPGTIPKSAEPAEYMKATAFEALIGYLYLDGRDERIAQLFALVLAGKE